MVARKNKQASKIKTQNKNFKKTSTVAPLDEQSSSLKKMSPSLEIDQMKETELVFNLKDQAYFDNYDTININNNRSSNHSAIGLDDSGISHH